MIAKCDVCKSRLVCWNWAIIDKDTDLWLHECWNCEDHTFATHGKVRAGLPDRLCRIIHRAKLWLYGLPEKKRKPLTLIEQDLLNRILGTDK